MRFCGRKWTRLLAKLIRKSDGARPSFLPNVLRIGSLADECKALDIRAYDVGALTTLADSFVICSASSEPHFKAVFNAVKEGMKEVGIRPLRTEGTVRGQWRLLDYGDIIFHLFREEARRFYDLDGLWGDAPLIDLELED